MVMIGFRTERKSGGREYSAIVVCAGDHYQGSCCGWARPTIRTLAAHSPTAPRASDLSRAWTCSRTRPSYRAPDGASRCL